MIVEFKGPELLAFCLTICLPRVCFGPNVSIDSLEVLAFTIQLINYCVCVCFGLAINVLTILVVLVFDIFLVVAMIFVLCLHYYY